MFEKLVEIMENFKMKTITKKLSLSLVAASLMSANLSHAQLDEGIIKWFGDWNKYTTKQSCNVMYGTILSYCGDQYRANKTPTGEGIRNILAGSDVCYEIKPALNMCNKVIFKDVKELDGHKICEFMGGWASHYNKAPGYNHAVQQHISNWAMTQKGTNPFCKDPAGYARSVAQYF